MPKIHKKFDDEGTPVPRDTSDGQVTNADQQPKSKGGESIEGRMPSRPKRPISADASGGKVQESGSFHRDEFPLMNKRQKLGGSGGFRPVNNLEGHDWANGAGGSQAKGIKVKPGLKANRKKRKSALKFGLGTTSDNDLDSDSAQGRQPVRPEGVDPRAIFMGHLQEEESDPRKWRVRPIPLENLRGPERKRKLMLQKRMELPIWKQGTNIRLALRKNDILAIVGETGSGKSTQIPQFIMNEPWCKKETFDVDGRRETVGGLIAVTQPRKIAATTLARRVSQETGFEPKDFEGWVGYAVRFDKFIPKNMKIKFVTEGMLLQELLTDPELKQYSAVIVDEIHERTLDVDLLTGFLKKIVSGDKKGRHGVPLKVVIMSATFDVHRLLSFFDNKKDGKGDHPRRPSTASHDAKYPSWDGFSNDGSVDAVQEQGGKVVTEAASAEDAVQEEDSNAVMKASKNYGTVNADTGNSYTNAAFGGSRSRYLPDWDLADWKKPDNASFIEVSGRQFSVKESWLEAPEDYLDSFLLTIRQIHTTKPLPGDILCFLAGEDEIRALQKMVEDMAATLNTKEVPFLQVMPLYGKMNAADQQKVFESVKAKRTRKVVLATNIAETSVTVPGVRYVVDGGKAKIKEFRPELGLDSLLVKPISQAAAQQRQGRAGRESEGECYHLYTRKTYDEWDKLDVPEILRTDVLHAVLAMKARGIDDPMTFPLMDRPEPVAISKALEKLVIFGALSGADGSVTATGLKMACLPLPPTYSRVIMSAAEEEHDCVLEVVDAIACLNADGDIFRQPTTEKDREETQSARDSLNRREGDILTTLNTMQRYLAQSSMGRRERQNWCHQHQVNFSAINQAVLIRKQLRDLCFKNKLLKTRPADLEDDEPVTEDKAQAMLKCFLKAFADKTAILLPDKSYRTLLSRDVIAIHPSSVLHGKKVEAILFLEQVYTSKHFAKKVSMVQMDWVVSALAARSG